MFVNRLDAEFPNNEIREVVKQSSLVFKVPLSILDNWKSFKYYIAKYKGDIEQVQFKNLKNIYWTNEVFDEINENTKWNLANKYTSFLNHMTIKLKFKESEFIFLNFNKDFYDLDYNSIMVSSISLDICIKYIKNLVDCSKIIYCGNKINNSLFNDIDTYFELMLEKFLDKKNSEYIGKYIKAKKTILDILKGENAKIDCSNVSFENWV